MGKSNTNKMTIVGRIEQKIPDTPFGNYDVEKAFKATMPNERAAVIKEDLAQGLSKKDREEATPDAGIYEPYSKFGDIKQKMTLGGKYRDERPSGNPALGQYDVDAAAE